MHGLGHRARSIALLRLTALCLAVSKAALAQAPQPFLPAVSTPHFALVPEFAAVDVNRDGRVNFTEFYSVDAIQVLGKNK